MDYLEIEGGSPLCGEVRIQGSKNAVLPILCAALESPGVTVLENCPDISDVGAMLEILKGYGCRARREGSRLVLDAGSLHSGRAPEDYAGMMRSSIMLLGSLLARLGEAFLPYPGGCVIGKRPIDIHLQALRQLGAELKEEPEGLRAVCAHPRGARICLPFPSVGATENVVLLAARAEGVTVLQNAAREPEIVELCRFLNSMGARIEGAGTGTIRIRGVERLHETKYRIMPDRIVAGTYMLLAAAAGGKIVLKGAPLEQLMAVRQVLKQMGVRQESQGRELFLWCPGRSRGGLAVCTSPYPGFPTDLQSPLMAALCLAVVVVAVAVFAVKSLSGPSFSSIVNDMLAQYPYLDVAVDQLEYFVTMPFDEAYTEIKDQVIGQYEQECIIGGMSPEDAVENMYQETAKFYE